MLSLIAIGDIQIPYFWPFTDKTILFHENKVFGVLHIIVPILLSVGVLSQLLVWLSATYTYSDADDDQGDGTVILELWDHEKKDVCGCADAGKGTSRWHRYHYREDLGEGVQGWLHQVYYTLYNFWQHWLDSGLH